MATAIGVIVAQTTAFGRTDERRADNTNQNMIWLLRLSPMSPRNLAAIRLSSPVYSHDTVMIDAPNSSIIVSDA